MARPCPNCGSARSERTTKPENLRTLANLLFGGFFGYLTDWSDRRRWRRCVACGEIYPKTPLARQRKEFLVVILVLLLLATLTIGLAVTA
jgi:hypothetical protein